MSKSALEARLATISTVEAADYLGIAPGTLHKLRARGGGPRWCRVGGKIRYRLCDIDDFLSENTHEGLDNTTTDVTP